MTKPLGGLLGIGILDVLIVAIGLVLWKLEGIDAIFINDAVVLNAALIGVALVTFFGFLIVGQSMGGDWTIDKGGMRIAITAAVVTMYLVLVGLTAFLSKSPSELPPITQQMSGSFTGIVGVVVAFYFGSSAFVHVQAIKAEKKQE